MVAIAGSHIFVQCEYKIQTVFKIKLNLQFMGEFHQKTFFVTKHILRKTYRITEE